MKFNVEFQPGDIVKRIHYSFDGVTKGKIYTVKFFTPQGYEPAKLFLEEVEGEYTPHYFELIERKIITNKPKWF